ncbi:hypothetical protein [Curtobacterium sp. MCJR17_043]|uniref:primosomal protein N' family DNA-binding protein n=1 Tax=Curtobacterium sp. MCJR17_043 TaxID=2175660 RepID=UPI0024E03D2C|nr:hypothetical protein [Curtobacterium sp. MCJR17_043]WIB35086.1 hypothetical protein DEJ15_11560 [Curtobacterium sp. MCJR17_043]
MATVARVVLDSPLPQLDRLFDYRVPAEFEDDCVPGVRVKVPLRSGARMTDAYVVEVVSDDALSPEHDFPGGTQRHRGTREPGAGARARGLATRAGRGRPCRRGRE